MSILVQNLSKNYDQRPAVDDISFEVKTGEILGFLGPNGAGKTTTMKIITCYLAASKGDVLVNNKSIHDDQEAVKQLIGYLPENNPLYEDMTVMDYLNYTAQLQRIKPDIINKRIIEMIRLCGLDIEKHKLISELSKGYRQRVGLAQAMIHDPEILILDEPTTGLDPNQIIEIRNLIRELGKEKTVILSTHILPEVEATCDRILIINKGKIVADGTPETLRKQSQGNELLRISIEDYDSRDELIKKVQALETVGMIDSLDGLNNSFMVTSREGKSSKRDIFNLCVDNKWFLSEMTPVETKLEDIFRNLTTN